MLRKLGYCLLGLLTLGGSALAAQVQDIPLLADAGDEPALTIMESRDDALRIKIDIPRLTREELAIDNRLFQLLSFKGAEYEGEEGQPALPIFSRLVAVPAGASVSLNVASSKETTLEGYRILPQQPEEGTSFVIDEETFEKEIAPGRTFCFNYEIEYLVRHGLIAMPASLTFFGELPLSLHLLTLTWIAGVTLLLSLLASRSALRGALNLDMPEILHAP